MRFVNLVLESSSRVFRISHVKGVPKTGAEYIHRIGRTARAGESGKVVNLLSEHDHDNFARVLRDYSSFNIEKINIPRLERINISKKENFRPRGDFQRNGRFHRNGKNNFRRRDKSRW